MIDPTIDFITGNYQAAVLGFLIQLHENPKNPHAWANLGVAFCYCNDYYQALLAMRNAVVLDRTNQRAWFNLGKAHTALGMTKSAIYCFSQAARIPGSPNIAHRAIGYKLLLERGWMWLKDRSHHVW